MKSPMDSTEAPPVRNATLTHNNPGASYLRTELSPPALVRVVLEPLTIILSLFVSALAFDGQLDGRYLLLGIIVFYLTFPGHTPTATGFGALVRDVLGDWIGIVLILLFLGYATRTIGLYPPEFITAWVVLTPVLLFAGFRATPWLLPKLMAVDGICRRAVIVGAGDLGRRLAQRIAAAPELGISLVGFVEDRAPERIGMVPEGPTLAKIGELGQVVKAHQVDLVYVTLPMAAQPRNVRLLDDLRDTTASIYFVPDIFLFDLIQGRMDTVNGIPVVAACETPFYGVNGLTKRLADVILSIVILALTAPLLLMLAVGVKLSSPGPVLFKQRRYGLDGREITVYKFRSMTVQEDGDKVVQATKNDRRVTRFGAFLRRTSLDELPQFFNVLQGRMSIVGPRPHAIAHNELYRKLIKGYMMRHKVKPGITGWAQINGLRGETDSLDKMQARIEHDLDYLRNWSLRLDLSIIFRTVWLILFKRDGNAY